MTAKGQLTQCFLLCKHQYQMSQPYNNWGEAFHYPPDVFNLMKATIPVLNRSKRDVILFFEGAGVPSSLSRDLKVKLQQNRGAISKYEITQTLLERINREDHEYLRVRRELIKRVTEFDAFATCWPNDQLKAKGLVAELRELVGKKDSFTRMRLEKERLEREQRQAYRQKNNAAREKSERLENLQQQLNALFGEANPQRRGKQLEGVLNGIFEANDILIREDFTRLGLSGEGIIEQIDGVVKLDHRLYLVEMKWKKDKIGINDMHQHLGRIQYRAEAAGIFISESGFAPATIDAAKNALNGQNLMVLMDLEDIVKVLYKGLNLVDYLMDKIEKAYPVKI